MALLPDANELDFPRGGAHSGGTVGESSARRLGIDCQRRPGASTFDCEPRGLFTFVKG